MQSSTSTLSSVSLVDQPITGFGQLPDTDKYPTLADILEFLNSADGDSDTHDTDDHNGNSGTTFGLLPDTDKLPTLADLRQSMNNEAHTTPSPKPAPCSAGFCSLPDTDKLPTLADLLKSAHNDVIHPTHPKPHTLPRSKKRYPSTLSSESSKHHRSFGPRGTNPRERRNCDGAMLAVFGSSTIHLSAPRRRGDLDSILSLLRSS
jgi:hypothetical protein